MFAEIVFPLPFRNSFTYSIPKELEHFAKTGVRAVAPFGKRTLTGFIINTSEKTDIKEKIKPISDVLDDQPIFDKKTLKFYEWISEYYLSSLGEALKLGVPYGSDVETKRKIIVDQAYCEELLGKEKNKDSVKGKILKALVERGQVNFSYLQKILKRKNIYSQVRSLEKVGAITVLDEIEDAKVKVKTANYAKLDKTIAEIYASFPEIERRSPKQVKILLELLKNKDKSYLLPDLLKKTESSSSSVKSLEEKGFIKIFEKEIERKYSEEYKEDHVSLTLTAKQNEIINEVSKNFDPSKFLPYLLHGITGSGKTQVYIELIKNVLDKKRTALILVPEISLTPQITSRLFNNFGEIVTVIHSRMSIGERYDSWRKILKGKYKVVIGARSALFAPLKNIGIIIIDEEHDSSYKQFENAPKYQARDSAIILAKHNNCPIILGSATPSVESMYNALSGKYKLLELPERVDNAKLPEIELVNVSVERKKKKMENIFSRFLLDKIEDRLKKKEGVIILQNRRGFSTQVFCDDCSEIETCENCSVPLVYHVNKNILRCHYCGFIKGVPHACTNCGSLSIKYFGTGTERVEDELEYFYPNARIRRIDSDSISRKSSLSKILIGFARGDTDILVGTQMVSKGLDFSRVTLVGVIAAETTLWLPDFRADERTFQLLTQVSGRAGRSKIKGEVVIQTQDDKNFTLQKVVSNDYNGLYQKEINDREKMGYPPFTRIALIETKDLDEIKAKGAITDFYNELKSYDKFLKIMEPATAIIARLKGHYRFHILIKSVKEVDPGGAILRKAILNSYTEFNRKSRFRDVKLIFDIDPQSVM
ncbi:MAG TPA: primosomal protein N' [Ignavibacteriaceae bacterium]|nr:primosomal protein N' [Ignavibacteriaceae bacterium]